MIQRHALRMLCSSMISLAVTAAAISSVDADGAENETREVKAADLILNVPKSWEQVAPPPQARRFRKAQFAIPAEKGDREPAELVVYYFGGSGGGVDANIQRWVGQFEAKGREVKLTRGTSSQGPYVVVDVSGTFNKPIGPPILQKSEPMPGSRMLAVVLNVEKKGNYFLKLTGQQNTVTSVAEEFRAAFGGDAANEEEYQPKTDS